MKFLARLFLPPLRLAPDELPTTLNYYERQQRITEPPVESATSPAISMMFYRPAPGHYVGLGQEVIAERRKTPRYRGNNHQYTIQLRAAEEEMAATLQEWITEGYVNTIHDCWEKEENS